MAALAALVAQLLIRWGVQVDDVDAQRFYRRLGATPRPEILAAWTPATYGALAFDHGPPREPGGNAGSSPVLSSNDQL